MTHEELITNSIKPRTMGEARIATQKTLRPGDQEKWAAYSKLNGEQQLRWRQENGHHEYCRLQRLWFHSFID